LAVGDFDGDGKSDLIFENPNTGGLWQWQLDRTGIVSQGAVGVADQTYQLLGSGDFNGDGKDDVIWRTPTGSLDGLQAPGFVYMWALIPSLLVLQLKPA
jgi:hypothetical protein